MQFKPCIDHNACNTDGTHCRACRRSHAEINQLRAIVDQTFNLIKVLEYENLDDFFAYLEKKVRKKLRHSS